MAMYLDQFDRVTTDRDGHPFGEEETVRQEERLVMSPEGDDTEDLEEEELESALEEEEEDEPETREVVITIKAKVYSSYKLAEVVEGLKLNLPDWDEFESVSDVEVNEAG